MAPRTGEGCVLLKAGARPKGAAIYRGATSECYCVISAKPAKCQSRNMRKDIESERNNPWFDLWQRPDRAV